MLSYEVRNIYKGNIAFNAIARADYANWFEIVLTRQHTNIHIG